MDNSSKHMKEEIRSIAFHEAGHAYAHLLAGLFFGFVSIDPKQIEKYSTGNSYGYIFPVHNNCSEGMGATSSLFPEDFFECFKTDFVIIGGLVAETLYSKGKLNRNSSKSDVKILKDKPWMNNSGTFKKKYLGFLLAFAFELLKQKEHYSMINKIADALLMHKSLSYDQVRGIVQEQV